jgi:hypothetical protein
MPLGTDAAEIVQQAGEAHGCAILLGGGRRGELGDRRGVPVHPRRLEVGEVRERARHPVELAARDGRVRLGLGLERGDEHVLVVEAGEDLV